MTRVPRLLLPAAIAAVLLLPASVRADSIVISAGSLTSSGPGSFGRFDFSGAGFRAVGSTDMGSVPVALCFPCSSGEVVALTALFSGGVQLVSPLVIDGTTFSNPVGAVLSFTGPSIVMPQDPRDFSVSRPFTFSGSIEVQDETGLHTILRRPLTGQGTLTADFRVNPLVEDVRAFDFVTIRYDFAAAEPVPEPFTLLLVGSGLGGIAWRTRRVRRAP